MYLYNVKSHLIRLSIGITAMCSSYAMDQIVNLSACTFDKDEISQLQELIPAWQAFYKNNDYRALMAKINPIVDGCGIIYESKDAPISSARLHETICIVDMTKVVGATEPHFHRNEVEIYFILRGSGMVSVGKINYPVKSGDIVYIPKLIGHYTVPNDLVLAVVNIPYFDRNDFFDLSEADEATRNMVQYDHEQYLRLKNSNMIKNS